MLMFLILRVLLAVPLYLLVAIAGNWKKQPIIGVIFLKSLRPILKCFKPSLWPVGPPVTGYLNCDGTSAKTAVLDRRGDSSNHFWELCFGKRPAEELYDIRKDPDCIENLAKIPNYARLKDSLKKQMFRELKKQNDPRMFGNGEMFDQYEYANERHRNFYERYMNGEEFETGWVNESDFRVSGEEWRKNK